jgi:hypothetical protein
LRGEENRGRRQEREEGKGEMKGGKDKREKRG